MRLPQTNAEWLPKSVASTLCTSARYLLLVAVVLSCVHSVSAQQRTREDLNYCRGSFFGFGNNVGYLLDVVTDAQGYVYGTGWCTHIQTTIGAYAVNSAGRNEVMVFKMDPSLSTVIWATYIGGSNDDAGGSISLNAAGEVIVSGYTFSPNFPVVNGVGQSQLQNEYASGFVLKLSADGSQLIYSSIISRIQVLNKGLADADRGVINCLNAQGEVYFTSQAVSSGYELIVNGQRRTYGGGVDVIYGKVSNTGAVVKLDLFGGQYDERPTGIMTLQNHVYICGNTNSDNMPLHWGKSVDAGDGMVLVLTDDASGLNPTRVTTFGSGALDVANGMCYDPTHNRILLCGTAFGSNMNVTSALLPGASTGGYITAFDLDMQYQGFITILGLRVVPRTIKVNTDGSIFLGSYVTQNGIIPLTPNAFQSTQQGDYDGALFVVDSSGSRLLYGTFLAGMAEDYSAVTVCLYHQGCFLRVLVGLTTHSPNFPSTADSYQPQKLNGDEDQPALSLFTTIEDFKIFQDIKACQREFNASLSSVCGPVRVIWDFGDGTKDSSGTTVKHTYAKSGTYPLQIRMTYAEPDTVVVLRDLVMSGPSPVNAGGDQIVCKGNTRTQLHASGAQKYQWTPSGLYDNPNSATPVVQPTTTTTYYLHGVDANGCSTDDSLTLYVNEAKAIVTPDTSVCAGSSIMLHANGGLIIQWKADSSLQVITGNDVIATPKHKTHYHVVVTNGSCSDSAEVVVDVNPAPVLRMPTPQILCPGEASVLNAVLSPVNGSDTTGALYFWSPLVEIDNPRVMSPIIRPTQNRWYYLEVHTPGGCVLKDSVHITMRTSKILRMISDSGMCAGESMTLWAQGADAYQWTPAEGLNDPSLSAPVCSATHSMDYTIVTSTGPCVDTHRVHIEITEKPKVKAMNDTAICLSMQLSLHVQSGVQPYNYLWYPSEGLETSAANAEVIARPTHSMMYYIMAQSSQYCSAFDSVFVRVDSSLQLNAGPDQSLCKGELCTIDLGPNVDASALYTLQPSVAVFDAPNHRFQFVATNNQVYVVQMARGSCTATDSVSVHLKTAVKLQRIQAQTLICKGTQVHFVVTARDSATRVQWRRAGSADPLIDNPDSMDVHSQALDNDTDFEIRATNSIACDLDTVIHVKVVAEPKVLSKATISGCAGDSVAMNINLDQIVRVRWTPSVGLSSDTVLQPMVHLDKPEVYLATFTNAIGCVSVDSVIVSVDTPQVATVWIDSVGTVPGKSVSFFIHAQSPRAILFDRNLTLKMSAGAFISDGQLPEHTLFGERYITLITKGASIGPAATIIAEVNGTALLSRGIVEQVDILVDSTSLSNASGCLSLQLQPGKLYAQNCLGQARSIELRDLLQGTTSPQPVSAHAILSFRGQKASMLTLRMFDAIGNCVYSAEKICDGTDQSEEIDMRNLGSGLYQLQLSAAGEQKVISFMRVAGE